MGNFKLNNNKLDKKYLIACLLSIILAIICGIVLFIFGGISVYTYNFTDNYIFNVLNFKNVTLFFSHLAVDLFYFYVFFLIGYFTKLKYLTCPILFLKWFFAITYTIILFTCFSLEGIIVALIVFIPSYLVSTVFCLIIGESCRCLNKNITFIFPAVLALLSTIAMICLVNIIFRILIVIV